MRRKEYINEIIEMLRKLDGSDETFIKQLYIIVKQHLLRKRGR